MGEEKGSEGREVERGKRKNTWFGILNLSDQLYHKPREPDNQGKKLCK